MRTTLTKKVETSDEDVEDHVGIDVLEERTAVTATVETVDNDRELTYLSDMGEPGDAVHWLARTTDTRAKETVDDDQELLMPPEWSGGTL